MKKLLPFIFIVILPYYVMAETIIKEDIIRNTIWDTSGSPYIITSDIHVYPDTCLKIQAGVEINFDNNSSLTIDGELSARGDPNNLIKIIADNSDNAQKIYFSNIADSELKN